MEMGPYNGLNFIPGNMKVWNSWKYILRVLITCIRLNRVQPLHSVPKNFNHKNKKFESQNAVQEQNINEI